MTSIKKIKSTDTYLVRNSVLRKGFPLESCQFKHDDDVTTLHLGYYINHHLIGVVSIFKSKLFLDEENCYQIRGLAILENLKQNVIAKLLMKEVEKKCCKNKATTIWLNCKESSISFYMKLGYSTFGTRFEINGIDPYYKMYKKLTT